MINMNTSITKEHFSSESSEYSVQSFIRIPLHQGCSKICKSLPRQSEWLDCMRCVSFSVYRYFNCVSICTLHWCKLVDLCYRGDLGAIANVERFTTWMICIFKCEIKHTQCINILVVAEMCMCVCARACSYALFE